MSEPMRLAALIVAAGTGVRAGGGVPKQYRPIAGRALLAHAYRSLAAYPRVGTVAVAIAAGEEDRARPLVGDAILVTGGATRRESVERGLNALVDADVTHVLVHDAARPFVPPTVIDRLVAALDDGDAATPVLAVADTLVQGNDTLGAVVPRSGLHRVQTPQAFRLRTLIDSHARWPAGEEATDDAQMVRRLGVPVALVQGDLNRSP